MWIHKYKNDVNHIHGLPIRQLYIHGIYVQLYLIIFCHGSEYCWDIIWVVFFSCALFVPPLLMFFLNKQLELELELETCDQEHRTHTIYLSISGDFWQPMRFWTLKVKTRKKVHKSKWSARCQSLQNQHIKCSLGAGFCNLLSESIFGKFQKLSHFISNTNSNSLLLVYHKDT